MILKRAFQREILGTSGAVFTILFTIAITIRPIKILGMAANGRIDPNDVFILIGFAALDMLPIILVLTGFISILMVVSRWYQDSELVVWFASGISLLNLLRPILYFAIPMAVAVAVMTLFVSPLAAKHRMKYTESFEKRSDIERIVPGRFQESASRDRVFFVEGVAGDLSKIKNIFVSTVQKDQHGVVTAKEGKFIVDDVGDKFLVLEQGHRYNLAPNEADFQLMQFDRYTVLVQDNKQLIRDRKVDALTVFELLADQTPFNMGELLWRISIPMMGLVLMLFAAPLSYVNPRAGRSANFLLALFLFVLYYNLILVSQVWVEQSQYSFTFSWWPIHLVFLLLMTLLFCWRLNVNSRYHPLRLWAMVHR